MVEPRESEFYVGYQPRAPRRLGLRTRRTALILVLLSSLIAALVSSVFRRLPRASFEYGSPRHFEGTISAHPYPALLVPRPGDTGGLLPYSRYHLVGEGKHGVDATAAAWDGRAVALEGTLVHRDGQTMIEWVAGSLRAADRTPVSPAAPELLGTRRVRGQIVDSKCFLGVMNPGDLKVHRACAARCIAGGIPPVLCVRPEEGPTEYLLLTDPDGKPVNARVLEYVAEPIEVVGELLRHGEQLVLRADPSTYRRL